MRLRFISLLLLVIALATAGYAWFRYLTWQGATELRFVRWELPGSQSSKPTPIADALPSCSRPPILHGTEALFYSCHIDLERRYGLWNVNYATGVATLRNPAGPFIQLFAPSAGEQFGIIDDDVLKIGGPNGWIAEAKLSDEDARVIGLGWVNDELQAFRSGAHGNVANGSIVALRADGAVRTLPAPRLRTCRSYDANCENKVILHDKRWWVLLDHHDDRPCWGTAPADPWRDDELHCLETSTPITHSMQWVPLQAGHLRQLFGSYIRDLGWDGLTPPTRSDSGNNWRIDAVVWQGAELRPQITQFLGNNTMRFTIDGKNIDLTYRTNARGYLEVSSPGNPRPIAIVRDKEEPNLSLQPSGQGGFYISDGQGGYATLDAKLARVDHSSIWDHLRFDSMSERRAYVVEPNWWLARWLGWAMYGPLVITLVLIVLSNVVAQRRRRRAMVPEATAAPKRWVAGLVLSIWVPLLLFAYTASAAYGLLRVRPWL
ncbi:MAG TPA: hypothetical protein PLF40_01505 [Kofleriaceae bacterium]|nr:hypothetical protein [Kofleriaceae bacterium]